LGYQALKEVKLREEGSDKEIHLIEFQEECVQEVDEGELLVLKRALSGHKVSNCEEKHENIFQTKCTIDDLVCSLNAHGGSYADVASTTLVEKLQLKAEPHPQPYSIQWLNQGKGLRLFSLFGGFFNL